MLRGLAQPAITRHSKKSASLQRLLWRAWSNTEQHADHFTSKSKAEDIAMSEKIDPLTAERADLEVRRIERNWEASEGLRAIADSRHRVYDASTHIALMREDVKWFVDRCEHEAKCSYVRTGVHHGCTCGLTERLERVRGMMK
jgi:hypothetical protein